MALHDLVINGIFTMSRIGKQPVIIPAGVDVKLSGQELFVNGPKGKLKMNLPVSFEAVLKDKAVCLSPKVAGNDISALHGLYRSIIANMVKGVTSGYVKMLEIQGVGFKAALQGKKIIFNLGFSRPVEMNIPEGIEVKIPDNVNLTISGSDKQLVGNFAARVKALFPAEPYKGKGIRFKGEYVRRKVGKTVA